MLNVIGKWHGGAAALSRSLLGLRCAAAQAEDFFSALFGAFGGAGRAPADRACRSLTKAGPRDEAQPARASLWRRAGLACGPATAAISRSRRPTQSRAASCNSFCPASATKVVYGSNIDDAATETGKPYSELPNAFRYRDEIVAGCTCNGKDQFGLAPVTIENDPTLRKGDIVAGADGLMIANPGSGRRAEVNFTPAPESVRMRFRRRAPVVARE